MGPVRLGVGTQWLLDGRVWRVVRQLAPDRFVAQDVQFHVEQEFSQQEIHAHYAEGRLQFPGGTDSRDYQAPLPRQDETSSPSHRPGAEDA